MKEFIELVRRMRDAQKRYFQTRDKAVLAESKRLEGQVDKRIVELQNQTELFG